MYARTKEAFGWPDDVQEDFPSTPTMGVVATVPEKDIVSCTVPMTATDRSVLHVARHVGQRLTFMSTIENSLLQTIKIVKGAVPQGLASILPKLWILDNYQINTFSQRKTLKSWNHFGFFNRNPFPSLAFLSSPRVFLSIFLVFFSKSKPFFFPGLPCFRHHLDLFEILLKKINRLHGPSLPKYILLCRLSDSMSVQLQNDGPLLSQSMLG